MIRYLAKKLNASQTAKKDKQPEISEVARASDLGELRNSFNESMKKVDDQTTEIRKLRESLEEIKQAVMEHCARGATSAEVGVTVARHSQ